MAPVNRRYFVRAVTLGCAGAVLLGRQQPTTHLTAEEVARIFGIPERMLIPDSHAQARWNAPHPPYMNASDMNASDIEALVARLNKVYNPTAFWS